MTRPRSLARRYQKFIATLIMGVLLTGMVSAAGERSAAPTARVQVASRLAADSR